MGFASYKLASAKSDFLRSNGGYAVIDGGFATELERHGADLNDSLWSAKCLIDSPHLVRRVHLDYLEAGADIIITASYQATIQGFMAKGFDKEESEALLQKSVQIACEVRADYYENNGTERSLRNFPILVAASVGSYGAYLADGSEYSGDYGEKVTLEYLKEFHRRRIRVLAESGADLIAFETIPNKLEAQAYAELLEEDDIKIPAWFSFTSNDGVNVVSGDSILECASVADSCDKVLAVGINCTPRFIHGLILSIQQTKTWIKSSGMSDIDFISYVNKWHEAGASLIGGCCRTTPNTIRAISNNLSEGPDAPRPSEHVTSSHSVKYQLVT
ncbi:hypothetical protein MKW98_010540 [Papaver atlanticum]|uniref:Hcy-binding domain-containing protein n=1 Tax=Papaver atlanticum TaxID=357466 RepID=A0AAD4S2Y3_9MAGN|nr:hypothetical protein MKW98_010540 [Papaver atlanticum]